MKEFSSDLAKSSVSELLQDWHRDALLNCVSSCSGFGAKRV